MAVQPSKKTPTGSFVGRAEAIGGAELVQTSITRDSSTGRAAKPIRAAEGRFRAFKDSVIHVGTVERINRLRVGIKPANIIYVSEHFNVSRDMIGNIIGIAPATMSRKIKSNTALSPAESERLERIAEIEAEAEDVFGDSDKARNWLLRNNVALGSMPLSLLDTEIGTGEVRKVLNAIAYGGAV